MKKSLTHSIGFWLLLLVSLVAAAVGGWIISGQLSTMTSTLLDGTATGVEVYVGQSLIVFGAALVGAGVLGILIALALVAVQAILPASQPVAVEAIDWSAQSAPAEDVASAEPEAVEPESVVDPEAVAETASEDSATEDQNGSSGSIATATKISVK
ncbi:MULTISPECIES: hypothetical protein [Microbacterium]|uniref:hypothetical protein n=1 Tax=Microbacterium TaxID=33882 RepID=UPI0011B0D089|nr:hypothetical protein [Microbacterium sp. MYb72]